MTRPFEPAGKIVAITGGASGIGLALAGALKRSGAAHVAIVDLNEDAAREAAAQLDGSAHAVDVSDGAAVRNFIASIEAEIGPIDLYVSNAGVGFTDAPDWTAAGTTPENWDTAWRVNALAHVHAARALLPAWLKRRQGHFLITASAAGLLTQIGDAAYSVTKAAAVAYAETLAITHTDAGIGVSLLCPQAVDTPMIRGIKPGAAASDGILSPEEVASETLRALRAGEFLILPHPGVREYVRAKAADTDGWIRGMRRFRERIIEDQGTPL